MDIRKVSEDFPLGVRDSAGAMVRESRRLGAVFGPGSSNTVNIELTTWLPCHALEQSTCSSPVERCLFKPDEFDGSGMLQQKTNATTHVEQQPYVPVKRLVDEQSQQTLEF